VLVIAVIVAVLVLATAAWQTADLWRPLLGERTSRSRDRR